MKQSYVSFGADVSLHLIEPYGLDGESLELPKEPANAHIRIINNGDDAVQVFLDIEGVPMMLLSLPKDIEVGSQFTGTTLMSQERLVSILLGQDELVEQWKNTTDDHEGTSGSEKTQS